MNWHRYGRRKKEFLAQIERIVLWKEWLKLIQPCYYKGERSNKPYPLEIMLRLYLLQNLYDLSDKATVAEAIDSCICKMKVDTHKSVGVYFFRSIMNMERK